MPIIIHCANPKAKDGLDTNDNYDGWCGKSGDDMTPYGFESVYFLSRFTADDWDVSKRANHPGHKVIRCVECEALVDRLYEK